MPWYWPEAIASCSCVACRSALNWASNSVSVMPLAAAISSIAALDVVSHVLAELADR